MSLQMTLDDVTERVVPDSWDRPVWMHPATTFTALPEGRTTERVWTISAFRCDACGEQHERIDEIPHAADCPQRERRD